MASLRRDLLIWGGGALLVVLGVLVVLYLTAPKENLLPDQYGFGIL
jgi:hypothetical protein